MAVLLLMLLSVRTCSPPQNHCSCRATTAVDSLEQALFLICEHVATSCDSAFCEVQLWPAAGTPHSPALATALAQQVAACDFQWAGWGLGIQDVVYLLWSSVQPEVVQAQEELLLEWYRGALDVELRSRGFSGAPPANMLQAHYQVWGFMHHVRRFLGWSLLSFVLPIQSELCTQHCARSIRSGI
jgi:hypothetical protein